MRNILSIIKKHSLIGVLFLTICFRQNSSLKAQTNLVPNPSFEQYSTCPDNTTLANAAASKPDFWYKPDTRGGGYLNTCAASNNAGVPTNLITGGTSYQPAKTGNGYIIMFYFNGNNNYFQVKLIDTLKANKYYYAEYYVNLTNISEIACNNQSMLFTKTPVYVDTANNAPILPANPQITNYKNGIIADTVNWVKVSGIFKAQGGEQYLTLGNFRNLLNDTKRIIFQTTGYGGASYYADDVSVIPLDSFCLKADAGKDTAITLGDSVFIGSYTNGIDSLKWLNGNTIIDSLRPGFWVKPTASTFYILQQTVNGCFSSDTVYVNVGTVPLAMINYKLLMINEKQVLNEWTTANEINVSHFNVQRSVNGKDFISIGTVKANNKSYNEYVFKDNSPLSTVDSNPLTVYYRIESIDKDGRKGYSTTQQITIKPQTLNGFSIFPNPAKDVVNIECKDGIKLLLITDYLGRTIKQYKNITQRQTINCKQFPRGLYLLQVITNKNEIKNEKLLVE